MPKNISPFKKYFFVIFAVGFFTLSLSFLRLQLFMSEPINVESETAFLVKPGSNITALNKALYAQEIVSHPSFLAWYARLNDQVNIKAGEYWLKPEMSSFELLALFNDGDVVAYPVSLIEGWTVKDALKELSKQEKLSKQLLELPEETIKERIGITEDSMEGLLFPDTYHYTLGSSDLEIARQAYRRMKNTLEEEWQNRSEGLPYANAYEALIMASIVEKETGVPSERQEIAGVFVRRLQKGMKLQTDPTVIYGLGESYQGNIRKKHLSQPTPYNTYVIAGLPPTPIALAGREAIHAALHPAPGSSLYFVAKGDGSHQFSDTLEEHNKAVRQYQLKRRKDYRSSPGQKK